MNHDSAVVRRRCYLDIKKEKRKAVLYGKVKNNGK